MMKQTLLVGFLIGVTSLSGATLLDVDFTKGDAGLKTEGFSLRNIKYVTGSDGGIIADKTGQYSAASRSASGVFNPGKGSLVLEFAPVTATRSFQGSSGKPRSMTLLEVIGPDHSRLSIGAVMENSYQIIGLCYSNAKIKIDKHVPIQWKKGEIHQIEFAWTTDRLTGKLDGKELFSEKLPSGMFMPQYLSVCGYNNSVFLIRRLMVSDGK